MPEDPSTVLRERPRTVVDVSATFTLTIVEGRNAGLSLSLDGARPSRAYVGTSPACDLRLEDRHVSRRHAALDVRRDRLRVNDLQSTNGTIVDGIEIAEAFLKGGEHLTLGETVLRVELAAAEAQHPISPASSFGRVLGESVAMRRLYPLCERLATSDVPVVIEGETGAGKELLAESIHETSARSEGQFVVFDCTTIPNELVEATLFGAEAGALSPGSTPRVGVFEQASGGTLLIDEIGELDARVQPKLLRAIERGEIRRVGAERSIQVDVRILAATRRDLELEVQAGRLRDDLFFRLAVARIELPPLRERIGDAVLLAEHFWRKLAGNEAPLPGDLRAQCAAYSWPGNVRELENLIARRAALGDLPPVPPRFSPGSPAPAGGVAGDSFIDRVLTLDLPLPEARARVVDHFERRYVEQVLAAHGGNVARAAAASGIARRYFQILRARHGK
jgi:DNA-binding NtrC family response regulator